MEHLAHSVTAGYVGTGAAASGDMAHTTMKFVAVTPTSTPDPAIERYQDGWRAGKPIEDPEKLKRWGYIGAKPSEYLVCTRHGQIDRSRSGQGVRIFKWPRDSVAIVPTTLQRVEFTADQVTRERVGVEISGIAVYRIAEPELAFRVLNFSYGEAASEKLGATLREMFVGAARRLVANLSLDECLTRRKETIATFLMEEISPVVTGTGAPSDHTAQGWGVVIDTIEIQQVRIQSGQVFAHLQAPYRAEIATRAELAELERKRLVAERRAETERQSREAELESARATRMKKATSEAEATEVEAREAARRAEMTAAARRRDAELERDRVLHQIQIAEDQRRAEAAAEVVALEADRARVEAVQRAALLHDAHQHAREAGAQVAELERERSRKEAEHAMRRHDAEVRELEQQLEVTHQRRLAEVEQMLVQGRALRELVMHALPQLASAMQVTGTNVSYTQIGGDTGAGPLSAIPSAIAQILALVQSFGLELPKRED